MPANASSYVQKLINDKKINGNFSDEKWETPMFNFSLNEG